MKNLLIILIVLISSCSEINQEVVKVEKKERVLINKTKYYIPYKERDLRLYFRILKDKNTQIEYLMNDTVLLIRERWEWKYDGYEFMLTTTLRNNYKETVRGTFDYIDSIKCIEYDKAKKWLSNKNLNEKILNNKLKQLNRRCID